MKACPNFQVSSIPHTTILFFSEKTWKNLRLRDQGISLAIAFVFDFKVLSYSSKYHCIVLSHTKSFILFKQVPLYSPQPHKSLKMLLFFHYVFSCTVTIAQSRMVNAEDKCFWSIICSKKIHQIEGKFYGSAMRPAMKTYFPILV